MPLGKHGRYAFFPLAVMAVHAMVPPFVRAVPEDGARQAKEDEQEQEREEATQEAKARKTETTGERHAVVRVRIGLDCFAGRSRGLDILGQTIGHTGVIGEDAQPSDNGQQHQC